MRKEMRSLLAAPTCLLVVLLGVGLMQVTCSWEKLELLKQLDQPGLDSDKIIAILNNVEDKDGVTIDGKISVAELLQLLSTTCELKDHSRLWKEYLIKTGIPLVDKNMKIFQNKCTSLKKKSCIDKIKIILENVVKEVPKDKKGSYPEAKSVIDMDELARNTKKHDKFFSNCIVLLEKLTELVPGRYQLLLDFHSKLNRRWLDIADSCETYLQLRCQYILSPGRVPKDSKKKCEELYRDKKGDYWPRWLPALSKTGLAAPVREPKFQLYD